MKATIKRTFAAAAAAFALIAGVVFMPTAPVVQAQANSIQDGVTAANPQSGDDETATLDEIITTIINTLLYIIGILSVIMLIYGGIRYTVSGGDSSAVTSAKNTILYAIIGLIVAFLAYAVVNWVLGALSGNTGA